MRTKGSGRENRPYKKQLTSWEDQNVYNRKYLWVDRAFGFVWYNEVF